jgi:hypothetical protein
MLGIGQRRARQQLEPVEPQLGRENERNEGQRCGRAHRNGETPPFAPRHEPEQTDPGTDLGQERTGPCSRASEADDDERSHHQLDIPESQLVNQEWRLDHGQ